MENVQERSSVVLVPWWQPVSTWRASPLLCSKGAEEWAASPRAQSALPESNCRHNLVRLSSFLSVLLTEFITRCVFLTRKLQILLGCTLDSVTGLWSASPERCNTSHVPLVWQVPFSLLRYDTHHKALHAEPTSQISSGKKNREIWKLNRLVPACWPGVKREGTYDICS